MKRSLQSDGTVVRDDCDSCIQAILEPASLNTEEASCQTDCNFSAIFEFFHPNSSEFDNFLEHSVILSFSAFNVVEMLTYVKHFHMLCCCSVRCLRETFSFLSSLF